MKLESDHSPGSEPELKTLIDQNGVHDYIDFTVLYYQIITGREWTKSQKTIRGFNAGQRRNADMFMMTHS
jgi:hypothetical protein